MMDSAVDHRGALVYATEEVAASHGRYRCPECGYEVNLRQPLEMEPHFAHVASAPRTCPLRVKSAGGGRGSGIWGGQRREEWVDTLLVSAGLDSPRRPVTQEQLTEVLAYMVAIREAALRYDDNTSSPLMLNVMGLCCNPSYQYLLVRLINFARAHASGRELAAAVVGSLSNANWRAVARSRDLGVSLTTVCRLDPPNYEMQASSLIRLKKQRGRLRHQAQPASVVSHCGPFEMRLAGTGRYRVCISTRPSTTLTTQSHRKERTVSSVVSLPCSIQVGWGEAVTLASLDRDSRTAAPVYVLPTVSKLDHPSLMQARHQAVLDGRLDYALEIQLAVFCRQGAHRELSVRELEARAQAEVHAHALRHGTSAKRSEQRGPSGGVRMASRDKGCRDSQPGVRHQHRRART